MADGNEQPTPDGYGGFNWVQAGVYNPDGTYPGYEASSEANIAFVAEYYGDQIDGYESGDPGDAMQITRSDGADFNFVSADFRAGFRDGVEITVDAFDDGLLVGTKTFVVGTAGAENVTFEDDADDRFSSIDELKISAADGWEVGLHDDYFYIDNFAYSLDAVDTII